MASDQFKKIEQRKADTAEIREHNLKVMLPFIKFGVGAIKMLAHTLLYIVKHIPKPSGEKPENKSAGRVIKVK